MDTTKPEKSDNLSEREKSFCIEYALCQNASEAARRVGYSPQSARVTGSRLRAKPEVRALCDELIAQRLAESKISADSILSRLDRLATWCMVPTPVHDRHGRVVGERPTDAAAALRALELLGKNLGIWTDRVEQVTDQTVEVVFMQPVVRAGDEDEFDEVPLLDTTSLSVRMPSTGDDADDDDQRQDDDDDRPDVGRVIVM